MSCLKHQSHAEIFRFISRVRDWERNNLPYAKNKANYDLALAIMDGHINGRPVSIKDLQCTLYCSHRNTRYIIDEFILSGLISIEDDCRDKRRKIVKITKEFEEISGAHLNSIELLVKDISVLYRHEL